MERLASLQRRLVAAAAGLVRPGGTLIYSVCTLTAAESTGIDDWLAVERPELLPAPPLGDPWQPWGRGAMLLPQAAGTDGMCLFRYVREPSPALGSDLTLDPPSERPDDPSSDVPSEPVA